MNITGYSFGWIEIDGRRYQRDLLITEDRLVTDNWWRREGHLCDSEDLAPVLDEPVHVLILGQGTPGMMQATKRLRQECEERGIQLIEQPTSEAVTTFNRLQQKGGHIVAGFHLTC